MTHENFDLTISPDAREALDENRLEWLRNYVHERPGVIEEETILIAASGGTGSPEVVEVLLELGADIRHRTYLGISAVERAVTCRRFDILDILIAYGADLNPDDPKTKKAAAIPRTPLVVAAQMNDPQMTQYLLERGADPNFRVGRDSWLPLYQAVDDGHEQVVDVLLHWHLDFKKKFNRIALSLAARHGNLRILQKLWSKARPKAKTVKPYADRSTGRHLQSPLEEATKAGNLKCMEFLLDKGADPLASCGVYRTFENPSPPLWLSIREGQLDALNLLLNRGTPYQFDDESERLGGVHPTAFNFSREQLLKAAALSPRRDMIKFVSDLFIDGPVEAGIHELFRPMIESGDAYPVRSSQKLLGGRARYQRAECLYQHGLVDSALEQFRVLIEWLDDGGKLHANLLAETSNRVIELLRETGRHEEADELAARGL